MRQCHGRRKEAPRGLRGASVESACCPLEAVAVAVAVAVGTLEGRYFPSVPGGGTDSCRTSPVLSQGFGPVEVAESVRAQASCAEGWEFNPSRVKSVTNQIYACCYLAWHSALIG